MESNIPTDLLEKAKFKAMSPGEKERYTAATLRKILNLNPNGITLGQLISATYFNRATLWRHLEKLTTTREAYKLEFGGVSVYYANGKLIHPLFSEDLELKGKTYPIFFVKNNLGDFIYIQECQEDKLSRSEVVGGLIVPYDLVDELSDRLKNIKRKVTEIERNKSLA